MYSKMRRLVLCDAAASRIVREANQRKKMNLLKNVSERLVSMFIPAIKAGACVPEHGQVCGYKHYTCTGACI